MARNLEGGFSPAAPEPARDGLRPDDEKTSAAAAIRNREMTGAPATLGEALDLAHSENAARILRMAGRISLGRSHDQPSVDSLDLLVAALETRKDKPTVSTVASLFDWIKQRNGKALFDFLERAVAPGDDGRDLATVSLTKRARALLSRALLIARRTAKRNDYDDRHIIAALILPDANGSNEDVLELGRKEFGINLGEFAGSFFESVTKYREGADTDDESLFAWREIRRDPPPSPLPVLTLAGFSSDSVAIGAGDPLGIVPDVRAFARLICLEQAKPPLSICIFGEWGSGKSSFMERLQWEIEEVVKSERRHAGENGSRRNSALRFVEDIVQIRFNAWHYADANLWASLTAVFFDQLRWGGAVGAQRADYQRLIAKVANRVRSLEAGADHAEKSLVDARRRLEAADSALDKARKDLAGGNFVVASHQLAKRFEEFQKDSGHKQRLEQIGQILDRENLPSDVNAFADASTEAATVSGKIKLIVRVLASGSWATRWALLGVVLLAVAGAGLRYPGVEGLGEAVQGFVAWGGGGAALLAAVLQSFRVAQPILDGAWTYAKGAEEERQKLRASVEQRSSDVQQAAAKLKEAESAFDSAMKPLREYGGDATANAPGTILRHFLFEDSDVRDYDKQVGIVSRARRSFEQLNAIAAAARSERNAQDGAGGMRQEEAGFQVPDRIVLYIDDLDRCSHEQVYAVLQAIHLLLAFELFVVVVGVDVSWVEGAVAKYFEGELTNDEIREAGGRSQLQTHRRKRAADYLEKIFQIAFWLQPLSTGDADGDASGGTYKAYVDKLFEENVGAAADESEAAETTPQRVDRGELTQAPVASRPDSATGVPRADEHPDDLAAVRLDPEELKFLTSKAIGDLAGKSPRAVKRFVNIYRIVRARLSDFELAEFLGRDDRPPLYPMAALIAAVETGQRMEVADAFYLALKWLPGRTSLLAVLWKEANERHTEANDPERVGVKALRNAVQWAPALGPAIDAVDEKCRKSSGTVESYLKLAQIVRRYSFNRYH
jgi:KAP family P-loop domain